MNDVVYNHNVDIFEAVSVPDEFEAKMQEIRDAHKDNKELMIGLMQGCMARVLREHGYEKGIEIFEDALLND
jgi:hypothetical protein